MLKKKNTTDNNERRGKTDMSLKIRKLTGLFMSACVLMLACAFAGCAQQGGGLLEPTPKQIISGKNTIVPSAAALSMEATNFCNAQAQVDYAALVLYCEGKAPTLPLSFSTTDQLIARVGIAVHLV